jgi:DNA helicase-2/ATP-dependent DNA helicase PcrA
MNNNQILNRSFQNTPVKNTDSSIPFPDEILHLEEINLKLDDALEEANADVERIDGEYMDLKRYMVENRGDIDPHEMFQNELALNRIDNSGAFTVGIRDRIAKLKESPYFSRIDFLENDSTESVKYYIGRFSFSYENELLIFDWRAPVASMFYDYEIGPAGFDAPQGRIEGKLTRKRQFKIKDGKLEYALESSVNIQDNILQQELSHTSDEKMKSIIATIQKEQNQIIRNEKSGTLIIQGVAGSGKTSIALHRIAFLLYRFKDRLSANNVTILSPNKVFGDYISNVLPELGEEPLYELSFADIAKVQLKGVIDFEADKDPIETNDSAWTERVRFKSTLDFLKQMDNFISQMPSIVFEPTDYAYGRFTAKAETINARFNAYKKYPVKQRLQLVADDIFNSFDTDNFMEDDIPESRTILKALNKMLKVKNSLSLYKAFYKQIEKPEMLVMPAKKALEWADVFPFLYLHAAYQGLQESSIIRHLVVDEMQDYTPIQYAVVNLLFKCQKTLLGDFSQFINPNHLHTLDDMRQLYDGAEFVELSKSYRSTYEIISFAKQIKCTGTIEAIERHGELPALIKCLDKSDELMSIKSRIDAFSQTAYSSLGIITKTNHDAKLLYDQLSPNYDVHLISPESTRFVNGISITSIQMSKGLEFDEVIVPWVDKVTYSTKYDRNLLYIACTRAMHRLTLLYTGEISPLLGSIGSKTNMRIES